MMYEVDAMEDREPEDNFISITTILSNSQVTEDFKRTIKNGEIFQTYFSMKDPELVGVVNLQVPAPTDDFENEFVDIATPTPFYENIVCSM